ncbi:MAG: hypothetical protein J2P25_15310 [Nocardiopsaceae bacterium]|nr:hypothetical protein [Nocardiopsaceae bacterium]
MIGLITAVAAMLLRSGIRRRGWGRFIYIVLAIAVLLWAFWYGMVKVGERAENQLSKSTGQSVPSVPAAPAGGPVRWHGHVTISSSGGLDLDQAPPKPGGSPDIKLGTAADQIQGAIYGGKVNLAPWSDRTAPDSMACLLQIAAAPRLRMTVRPGSTVCLQTASGRIATLTFTSVGGDHGSDSAEATIWSERVARR